VFPTQVYGKLPDSARKQIRQQTCKLLHRTLLSKTPFLEDGLKQLIFVSLAIVLCARADAQTSANVQTGATSNNSVSAGNSSATARSNTSIDTSADTDHQQEARHGKSSDTAPTKPALTAGANISAVLTHPVDSRHAKAGDPIYAKTTSDVKSDGKVIIPKGSALVGHVSEAKARAKGDSESTLVFTFDRAVFKGGHEIALNTVVQAMAVAQNRSVFDASNDDGISSGMTTSASGAARSGSGLLGGATSTVAATTSTVAGAGANVGGSAAGTLGAATNTNGVASATSLTSASSGVIGMNGMQLTSRMANSTSGSVVTSTGKSVNLASGTQMMLSVVK
jgi:hypothetical protein